MSQLTKRLKFIRGYDMESFFREAFPLFSECWEEGGEYKEVINIDVDISSYMKLNELGMVHVIVVKEEDEIVGFSMIMRTPHLHHKWVIYGSVDTVYLHPLYRAGTTGIRLISETEEYAKELGIEILICHTRLTNPSLEKILKRKGFSHKENVLNKYIGGNYGRS